MATSNIPFGLFFACPDPADFFRINPKKQGKSRDPLIQKLLPMNEHKRAGASFCNKIRADNGLAKSRRRREDPEVVFENPVDGLMLLFSQCSMERIRWSSGGNALVIEQKLDVMFCKELPKTFKTASRDGDMLRMFFIAGDHSRDSGS